MSRGPETGSGAGSRGPSPSHVGCAFMGITHWGPPSGAHSAPEPGSVGFPRNIPESRATFPWLQPRGSRALTMQSLCLLRASPSFGLDHTISLRAPLAEWQWSAVTSRRALGGFREPGGGGVTSQARGWARATRQGGSGSGSVRRAGRSALGCAWEKE